MGRSPDEGDAVVKAAWAENLAVASVQPPAGRYGRSIASRRSQRQIHSSGTTAGRPARNEWQEPARGLVHRIVLAQGCALTSHHGINLHAA